MHLELSHEIRIKGLIQEEEWVYPPFLLSLWSHIHTEGSRAGHRGTLCHRKGKGFF